MRRPRLGWCVVLLGVLGVPPVAAQVTQGTAFTYQGRLDDGGSAAQGPYDFQFVLYDALGAPAGPILVREDVEVTDGLFTVSLDFTAAFSGSKRWLEIGVRPGTSTGPFTPLDPRQELTPTPAALFSAAAPWTGVSGKPAGFADDVDDDSGGTVTAVTAGTGLSGGTITSAGTLSVSFGGSGAASSASRSDHHHNGTYAAAAHDHLGQSWTGTPATGLQVSTSGLTGVRGVVTAAGGLARGTRRARGGTSRWRRPWASSSCWRRPPGRRPTRCRGGRSTAGERWAPLAGPTCSPAPPASPTPGRPTWAGAMP